MENPENENIKHVIGYIESNLWSKLDLENLAQIAKLSKFHFCRKFKRHVGINPMKYVNTRRIEKAKELLKKRDLSVSLVASEVGFRDLSNFIRQFKKRTGLAPNAYRHAKTGTNSVNDQVLVRDGSNNELGAGRSAA